MDQMWAGEFTPLHTWGGDALPARLAVYEAHDHDAL